MDLRATPKALKLAGLCPPQLKDDGNLTGNGYVDTVGLAAALFVIYTGEIDAALGSTAEGTAPLVEECDTTNGTYTAVTGAALADAIADTEDLSLFVVSLDMTKTHKRYMRWQAPHAGNGTTGVNACAFFIGFPSDQMPHSAAGMGVAELIEA